MPEPTELPGYLQALKDELEVRNEVEVEFAEALSGTVRDAIDILGPSRAEKVALPHLEAEVQVRLRRLELERKRAGLT